MLIAHLSASRLGRSALIVAAVALALGGLYAAYRSYRAPQPQDAPALAEPVEPAPQPPVERTPAHAAPRAADARPDVAEPEALPARSLWDELPAVVLGKEPVNILLLGIDRSTDEDDPPRTDTMILLSIDPTDDTVAMLSIPRDLWVLIPGYGATRINEAHVVGERRNGSGGGVELAKSTVAQTLNVPVHRYVRIDFAGFERLIDAIGGVTVYLDQPVPPFDAGTHRLDGEAALQFARTRRDGTHFDRMARQQELLLLVLDKVRRLDIPLSAGVQLLDLVTATVQTDLSLQEMLALAAIAERVEPDDIRRGLIDGAMTTTMITSQGGMVELPRWPAVRALVDDLFPHPETSADAPAGTARAELAGPGGRIALLNGTAEPGLAEAAAEVLRATGFHIVRHGDAERDDYERSEIVVHGEVQRPARMLAATLLIPANAIQHGAPADDEVDVTLILGQQHLAQFAPR